MILYVRQIFYGMGTFLDFFFKIEYWKLKMTCVIDKDKKLFDQMFIDNDTKIKLWSHQNLA